MPVNVEVSQALYKKLDDKSLLQAAKRAVTDTTIDLEGECKDEAPVDTGNLQRSHSYHVLDEGKRITARVKNSTNYWVYVEYGTKKMSANGYIQRAISTCQPESQLNKRFHEYYKPGGG